MSIIMQENFMKFHIGDKVMVLNHRGTFEFLEYMGNSFWNKEKILKKLEMKVAEASFRFK
jgi:hypothetical protein